MPFALSDDLEALQNFKSPSSIATVFLYAFIFNATVTLRRYAAFERL